MKKGGAVNRYTPEQTTKLRQAMQSSNPQEVSKLLDEIAEERGIDTSAVRSRIYQIRKADKKKLAIKRANKKAKTGEAVIISNEGEIILNITSIEIVNEGKNLKVNFTY